MEFKCEIDLIKMESVNKKNGVSKVFYEKGYVGVLWREETYVNDKLHGVTKIYSPSKSLIAEEKYADGVLEERRKYYGSGTLQVLEELKDGKHEGVSKLYYADGSILAEITSEADEVVHIKKYDQGGNVIFDDTPKETREVDWYSLSALKLLAS